MSERLNGLGLMPRWSLWMFLLDEPSSCCVVVISIDEAFRLLDFGQLKPNGLTWQPFDLKNLRPVARLK